MILSRHSDKLNTFRAISDIICISLSWILAFNIRFNLEIIAITRGQDSIFNYLRLLPLLLICYLFIFFSSNIYKKSLEKKRIWEENFELIKNHTIAFFIFVTLSYFIYEHRYSRITLFIFYFILPLTLPIGRSIVRKINRFYLRLKNSKKKVIIIGNGNNSLKLVKAIQRRSDWNLELLACHSMTDLNEVNKHISSTNVDLIFIVPNAQETVHVNDIYEYLDKNISDIFLIPYLGEKIFFEPKPVRFEGITALALNSSGLQNYGLYFKRLFDICFSLLFIFTFSPVFLICAFLVKISSPGPIFFKQERMGLDGKKFNCIKYRGMYVNAEEKSGPIWAKSNDDRTTPIGKWLRKTSLDEIPQFFNVLKGDMSIVGPRPERPVFVNHFKEQIPGYMLRHKVKAGITGWAQINGWRGNTSLEKRIECDLWYIQNWNIWLDFKIIILTPIKGLIHPNAY